MSAANIAKYMQRNGVVVAFVLLFAVNAIWQHEVFLQPENLKNLLNQNVAVGIIAVGMTIVIATGGIDLSVGSGMALAAGLGVWMLNKSMGGGEGAAAGYAVLTCLLTGGILGALNGFLVAYGKIAPFVATLVGLVGFRSLVLALAEGGEIRSSSATIYPGLGKDGIPLPFLQVGGGQPLVITWGIVLFFLAAGFASLLVNRSTFGRNVLAVGSNETAAFYAGVDTRKVKFWAYTLLGLYAGLAAMVWSTRMNSVASSSSGQYYELDAIAAVVIGGTTLRGGSGRIWATVLGVLLLGVITNMLVVAQVSVYWQGVVKGAIILAAVLLQRNSESES
ncbi:MAG: ABC transporter permease [Armatimonadetes bacterium]|nr:ABC transporter permease [Armatimonadota bacterium]